VDGATPLAALLSNALIAFTIEFDNEFERQIAPTGRAPVFLVSLPMWSNYMRFVPPEGLPVGVLAKLAMDSDATVRSRLAGLERWGYVRVVADPGDARSKPPYRDWIVRVTPNGLRAQDIWRPLVNVTEQRWRERLGHDTVDTLRERLQTIAERINGELPQYMPVVTANRRMFSEVVPRERDDDPTPIPLFALLARVLLGFTLEFEGDSELALPMSANVVRVLAATGTRVRDLPQLTGVSKEAISMVLGFLEKNGDAAIELDPTAVRVKLVRLTTKGEQAKEAHLQQLAAISSAWNARFGADLGALHDSLADIVGPDLATSPLAAGLASPPNGWRASRPQPALLPQHPIVLPRGGWPDGS
jgi:DNA-binding MarR family transcriptional regulator